MPGTGSNKATCSVSSAALGVGLHLIMTMAGRFVQISIPLQFLFVVALNTSLLPLRRPAFLNCRCTGTLRRSAFGSSEGLSEPTRTG